MKFIAGIAFLLTVGWVTSVAQNNGQTGSENFFWKISPGQNAIVWDVTDGGNLPHADDIEMSGDRVSAIVSYAVDQNNYLSINRDVIFPQLRRFISTSEPEWQTYRAYLRKNFDDAFIPTIVYEEVVLHPKLDSVRIDGKLTFFHSPLEGVIIERSFFPSTTERQLVEKWTIKNVSDEIKNLHIGHKTFTHQEKGMHGIYNIRIHCDSNPEVNLKPSEEYSFGIYYSAHTNEEPEVSETYDMAEAGRDAFLQEMKNNLVLETPEPILNTLFYFSKIRASESIFESKMGLVHSPGGGNYYAGIWANDQVEYSGPFFPYLGYKKGNTAAYNAYMHFLKNIPEDGEFIKSSFEMEGDLPCCSKDRGDAAMISYGTSQFVLAMGNIQVAEDLWPLIEWSIAYCNSKLNEHGVVMSDTDEMEGRIPTGDANLSTSSLYYGGLIQAARIAEMLGKKPVVSKDLKKKAEALKKSIEKHFGATINGIETYRYYDGHTAFRHWICLPLVVDIHTRKEGTLKALFEVLWTDQGVLVQPGEEVFWDRGTLYAFRGAFIAGAADKAISRLLPYSGTRLLGSRVPYVVEAYPEHGMRHLSAESALYCRVFTEGLLGIEPTGLNTFTITPQIPSHWDEFSLSSSRILNRDLDFIISREGNDMKIQITDTDKMVWQGVMKNGKSVEIKL